MADAVFFMPKFWIVRCQLSKKTDSFWIQLFTFIGKYSYFVLLASERLVEGNMDRNDRIFISDAAWAWEGLRRNHAYRRAWARYDKARPRICDARASLRYVRLERPYLEAEVFGLIAFADPEHSASEVPVFWLSLIHISEPTRPY